MFNDRSFVLGNVQFRNLRSQELTDCTQLSHGQLIVDDDIEIIETEHPVTFILVVEKDTVFQVNCSRFLFRLKILFFCSIYLTMDF